MCLNSLRSEHKCISIEHCLAIRGKQSLPLILFIEKQLGGVAASRDERLPQTEKLSIE